MHVTKLEGKGLSPNYLWKSVQPGFINVTQPSDVSKTIFLTKKNNLVAWDGTFNQPVLPLADRMHKDACNYWSF